MRKPRCMFLIHRISNFHFYICPHPNSIYFLILSWFNYFFIFIIFFCRCKKMYKLSLCEISSSGTTRVASRFVGMSKKFVLLFIVMAAGCRRLFFFKQRWENVHLEIVIWYKTTRCFLPLKVRQLRKKNSFNSTFFLEFFFFLPFNLLSFSGLSVVVIFQQSYNLI